MKTKPFCWHEDFEDADDPVQFLNEWAPSKIDFKGVTTEKAYSGKQSYKLDISFDKNGAVYWGIPVNIPAEGKLKLTARLYIGEDTKAPGKGDKISIGADYRYEPILYKDSPPDMVGVPNTPSGFAPEYYMSCGARTFPPFREADKGKWLLVEADLIESSRAMATDFMNLSVWNVKTDNIARYIDRIAIYMFRMRDGGRLVVYIDDIKIEGEVPDEQAYKQEMVKRWGQAMAQTEQKLAQWEKELGEINLQVSTLNRLPLAGERQKKELLKRMAAVYNLSEFAEARKEGYIRIPLYDRVENFLAVAGDYVGNLQALKTKGEPRGNLQFYSVPTAIMPAQRVLPDDLLVSGRIMHNPELNVTLCPGEYEPASFVIRPAQEIKGLELKISALKSKENSLPASCIDMRTVKVWYQTEGGGYRSEGVKKVLIPELLLHDDSLVRVDEAKQENYLKLRFPDGDRYLSLDDTTPMSRDDYSHPNSKYPVKDTETLQPVDLPANRNKQFWVTVNVPDNTKGGIYKGTIDLLAKGRSTGRILLTVNVLPVNLAPTPFYTCIYGGGYVDFKGEGTVYPNYKTEIQYRNEMRNLAAHGIVNPMFKFSSYNAEQRKKLFSIRREAGIDDTKVLFNGEDPDRFNLAAVNKRTLPDGWQQKARDGVSALIAEASAQGVHEVYFYGMDEAGGERLPLQRPVWEVIRSAGGKMYCTGAGGTRGKGPEGNLAVMGDIQDLFISYGEPTREEAAQWHALGHKIGSAWNSGGRYRSGLGCGVEDPDAHRRLNGLMLWKNNYDGLFYYSYYEKFPWKEFAGVKAAAIVYPAVDGVIDTMQWEALREGIDDARYAATLEQAIRRTKNGADETKKAVAVEAEKYLEEMDIEFGDLDAIRSRIIEYILKLQ